MNLQFAVSITALVALIAPLALLVVLAVPSWLGHSLREPTIARATRLAMLSSTLGPGIALLLLLLGSVDPWVASFGAWFGWGRHGFAFDLRFDALALGFATLAAVIGSVDAVFSDRYLHRESGYNRYFVLFAMFVLGVMLIALAGSIEVLFAGWELLGLSSALLVGFFHERPAPVRSALRVFTVYRVSDAAMLAAAVLLHHYAGTGSLAVIASGEQADFGLTSFQSHAIALLLVTAVAGKSGLLPFSGWLPRAMEGPTSSSAVFYGSLSVHAGCFLLLRSQPLLEHAPAVRIIVIVAGITTAFHAATSARVQTDVKSALTYASLAQVGLIVTEIGLGLSTIAFLHIVGHACFRLLQFLSAPNILHDLHELEGKLGESWSARDAPAKPRRALFLFAIERGFVDALLDRFVVSPFWWAASKLDTLDRILCGTWERRG